MDEVEQVSQLIGDIYDAALDRSLWPRVLQKTCRYVNGVSALLGADDSVQRSVRFFFEWGVDPHYLRLHDEIYSRLNPMTVPTVLYAKVGSVLASSDLIPYDELVATRFFREWVAPQGIVDAISVTLDKSSTSYAAVVVQRHERHGLVNDAMRRRVGLLAPHFCRAFAIAKLIDLHKVEAAALADTLDGLAAGMFVVDADARIVHANASGCAMMTAGKVLTGNGGRLSATDPQAEQVLREMFAAAQSGDDAVGIKGIAVPLRDPDGEPWVAHVLPLTSGIRQQAGISYSAVAAVFVCKATLDLSSPLETLADVYKLTPAELRVLFTIVQVGGVPEVAPVLGISETTVKTHLQRVFEKTGVKRQADLVKLVAGYMSPLGGPSA
jgi:DNA-binding CsgD family transcriptional regulator/PAS domain-containing protein